MNLTTTDADRSFISIQPSSQPIFSLADPRMGSLHLNSENDNRGKTLFSIIFKKKNIRRMNFKNTTFLRDYGFLMQNLI